MKKITKQQYERAKKIVSEYETQSISINRVFTINDLEILTGTISIPCLNESVVDEDYAADLQSKLESIGYNIDYVSLDDIGHISVYYYGRAYGVQITDKHICDLLSILNNE